MRQSLKGHHLPETYEEFRDLVELGAAKFTTCIGCRTPFNADNTKTAPGWRETQITAMCEACFDQLFAGDEENV